MFAFFILCTIAFESEKNFSHRSALLNGSRKGGASEGGEEGQPFRGFSHSRWVWNIAKSDALRWTKTRGNDIKISVFLFMVVKNIYYWWIFQFIWNIWDNATLFFFSICSWHSLLFSAGSAGLWNISRRGDRIKADLFFSHSQVMRFFIFAWWYFFVGIFAFLFSAESAIPLLWDSAVCRK